MNEQHFIAIDKNDVIWGVGTSKTATRKDAQYTREKIKILPCSKALHDEVKENGYSHTDAKGSNDSSLAYWAYSKKRKIAYLPKKKKRANVFETL